MCQECTSRERHSEREELDAAHVEEARGAERVVNIIDEERGAERVVSIIDGSVIISDRRIIREVENQLQVSAHLEEGSSEVLDVPVGRREILTQYDEINPFFFAEQGSFIEPSSLYQEL